MLTSLNPDGADTLTAGRDEMCFGLPDGETPANSQHRHSFHNLELSEEVRLISDWIPEAGVAAEAAVDWTMTVPVRQIYLTTEWSRQSRFAQCQRGSSE